MVDRSDMESFNKKDFNKLIDSLSKQMKIIKRFSDMDAQLQDELIESFDSGNKALVDAMKRCRKSNGFA